MAGTQMWPGDFNPGNDFILTPNESMASAKISDFSPVPPGQNGLWKSALARPNALARVTRQPARQPPSAATAGRLASHLHRLLGACCGSLGARGLDQAGPAILHRADEAVHPHDSRRKAVGTCERLVAPGVGIGLATTVVRGIRPFLTGRPLPRPGAETSPWRHRRPQNAGRARAPHRWFLSPNVG